MKKSLLSLSTFLLALFAICSCASIVNAADSAKIERVALIGVDGAGAFFRDANTPNMDRIFKDGAISYNVVTSNPTISAQCWGSMLHGVVPEVHGLTNSLATERPFPIDSKFPSVFRVIRENMPDAKLASFCNWKTINIGIVEDSFGVDKGNAKGDAAVTDKVCDYLSKGAPTFLFVQFDDCDHAGHASGYGGEEFLKQIETTDGYVQRIYEAYEKQGLIDSTLFIVTADHGGNGKGHGGLTDGERLIFFGAAGPNVEKGFVGEMEVRDFTSIVLYALGLADKQPATWTSRVPSGLFKGVEAKERPVYEIEYAFEHRTRKTEPTPKDGAVDIVGKDRVAAYLPFDGSIDEALGKVQTKQTGKLYFVDGYFGQGATFDDGCVSMENFKLAKSSFSVAFWMKSNGVGNDPAIISNKDWKSGRRPGWILSLCSSAIKFNLGNGEARFDKDYQLPIDYKNGWVYVVFVVNRETGEISFSYDFGKLVKKSLSKELADVDFDTEYPLNIGQDGTGKYDAYLSAELDEFLLINGVLTDEDVARLKELYQK